MPGRRVEWPPPRLFIGQTLFVVALYLLGVGLPAATWASLALVVGDVLAAACDLGTLCLIALRLVGAIGAGATKVA